MNARKQLLRCVGTLAVALLMSGCTTFSPTIGKDAKPEIGKAYVFGRFALQASQSGPGYLRIGVELQEKTNGRGYTMQFDQSGDPSLVEVKPGTYSLTEFVFAYWTYESAGSRPVSDVRLTKPFVVEPGKAYYLGDYVGHSDASRFGVAAWRISSVRDRFASTTDEVREKYPGLRDIEFQRGINLGN